MDGLTQNEKNVWACWETKTPREIVREAAAKGSYIKLAYRFLRSKHDWDEETAIEWFNSEVFLWVLQLLSRKQFFKAFHVLNKINVPPNQHMLSIAYDSYDKPLRDYIIEQLIKTADDSFSELSDEFKICKDNWNLLKLIEKSFHLDDIPKQNKAFGVGKEIIIITLTDLKQFCISKIEKFSIDWKKKVSAHLFFDYFDFSIINYLEPEYCWNTLLQRNMTILLKRWVSLAFSRDKLFVNNNLINEKHMLKADSPLLESSDVVEKVDELFSNWKITTNMIETISKFDCFEFTKIYIYDALCSYGFVVDSEKSDLKAILRRLSKTNNLSNFDRLFCNSDNCNDLITQYCIRNNLYHALVICINPDLSKFNFEEIFDKGTENYMDLLLLFKYILNSKDTTKFVHAIFETCKYLSSENSSEYFTKNYQLVLAMLIFGKRDIFEIFNLDRIIKIRNMTMKWDKDFNVELTHLFNIYKKCQNNSLMVTNDVTVYQLLTGFNGLDISKAFEYQLRKKELSETTAFPKYDIEVSFEGDAGPEFPNFDNKYLMQKYGYSKQFNYLYYLKQNRPCTATQSLIIDQYQNFNRSSVQTLKDACIQAHVFALQNWNDVVITSVCISFIAMVGCDSVRCRTHIAALKLIASYLEFKEKSNVIEVHKKINCLVKGLIDNTNEVLFEILNLLVNAVEVVLESKKDLEKGILFGQIVFEWQTAIRFAYLHELPLPQKPLKDFVSKNDWVGFLYFGDIFMYSQKIMLEICHNFNNNCLIEHIAHTIQYYEIDLNDTTNDTISTEERRKLKECNETQHKSDKDEPDFSFMSDDLWEILINCHGPDDPPGALIKASTYYHCPTLALMATCYEPDAVETCWAQWMITSMNKNESENLLPPYIQDASDMIHSDTQMIKIMTTSIEYGYHRTLHESFIIFYGESPLCLLMKFIVRTCHNFVFGSKSIDILKSFKNAIARRPSQISGMERTFLSRFMEPKFIQIASIELLLTTLCKSFVSVWHKKKFLQCICKAELTKYYSVLVPDFSQILDVINISIKCKVYLDIENIVIKNEVDAKKDYVQVLINRKYFKEAFEFAKIQNICEDDILIAEWSEKFKTICSDGFSRESEKILLLQFWTRCCYSLKNNKCDLKKSLEFLKKNLIDIDIESYKFYFLRLIVGLYSEHNDEFYIENFNKSEIEFKMWETYLFSDDISYIHLISYDETFEYILNLNANANNVFQDNIPTPSIYFFDMTLDEIEKECKLSDIKTSDIVLSGDQIMRWIECTKKLLDVGLLTEAWRLNKMFKIPSEHLIQDYNLIHMIESCMKVAEGIISPYDFPKDFFYPSDAGNSRTRIKSSASQSSNLSCEEYNFLSENREDAEDNNSKFNVKKENDVLFIVDTWAVRSGCKIIKQISNYLKIGVEIGWTYERVLKYKGHPIDFISGLSGRSRMPLAKLVFRTFSVSPNDIVEYLCTEIITAIISSHLTHTSGFRQKEHFRYTLWGYPLDSDFEMFLNICPNSNSLLGKKILEYLGALRKLYNCIGTSSIIQLKSENVDEEYCNIESDDKNEKEDDYILTSPVLPEFAQSSSQVYPSTSYMQSSDNENIKEKRGLIDVISCARIHISSPIKKNIKALVKNTKLSIKQINVISIEFLVLAHECFSSVCDTEGIATVLRSAQTLTSHLLTTQSWRLMVSLLTGIARYTEMAYIFQILRDNDQFEFLLGQLDYMLGQNELKIKNFKSGLLEFLRKHCPGDTDIFHLVALHFSMYSEAADVKKKQVNDLIISVKQMCLDSMKALKKNTKKQPEWIILNNDASIHYLLKTALTNCSDAAELYVKGDRLVAAREMAALAQIIALQIHLLQNPPARFIFDLTKDKIISILESYLSFMEGLIYVHAIDVSDNGWIFRWKDIVYQRTLKKDEAFIEDIMAHRPDIAIDIIDRYDQSSNGRVLDELPITTLRSLFK